MQGSEPTEPLSTEWRSQLVEFLVRHGVQKEKAEDVVGSIYSALAENAKFNELSSDSQRRYLFRSVRNRSMDIERSPHRIVSIRVGNVLRTPNSVPITWWYFGKSKIVGLKSQRGETPILSVASQEARISDFLTSAQGLDNENPGRTDTRYIVFRLLAWLGAPIEFWALVNLIAEFTPLSHFKQKSEDPSEIPVSPIDASTDLEIPVNPQKLAQFLSKLKWRERAVYLFSKPERFAEVLYGEQYREILEQVVEGWKPPPPIREAPMPYDDDLLLAENLGTTRQNIHTIRSRTMSKVFKRFEHEL